MTYLHSQGVMHRDLKADNIVVTECNTSKIIDFGISKVDLASEEHENY